MDILQYIFSFSKISFIAFIVTFGFLIYEIVQLQKGKKTKKLDIPKFNPGTNDAPLPVADVIVSTKSSKFSIPRPVLIGLIGILMLIAGFFTIMQFFGQNKANNTANVQEVKSAGIKLYTNNWEEYTPQTFSTIKAGDVVIIGIQSIKDTDVDKARIRINKTTWTESDITVDYNDKYNVYYKQFPIQDDLTKLTIDAQLHSKANGWLED